MKLKEIPRAATFAWSPSAEHPSLVTGTAAGTIDADFSAETALELWKLDLADHSISGFHATCSARAETEARFHDVAFNSTGDIIVGALENGSVSAWKGKDLATLGTNTSSLSAPAYAVDFSRHDASKFATGGGNGQVFVWNTEDLQNPTQASQNASNSSGSTDVVKSVQWNTGTPNILASGGANGFARIWDVRRHREVLNLHYTTRTGSLAPISCVQWHPTNSTKLVSAALDDSDPVVLVWDMKNVNKPEQVLRGHTRGVLSLDWCRQDPELLLSGGRDNQTLLWNPEKGAMLGAYPISVEWVFKTQFHPKVPDIFATASFDGKISVQTLQDTTPTPSSTSSNAAPTSSSSNGADFWESDTVLDSVHPSFVLNQVPKWLSRPISAKFGFGGKLAIAAPGKLEVRSVTDPTLDPKEAEKLKSALKSRDFSALSADWEKSLKNLLEDKDDEEQVKEDDQKFEEDDFYVAPQYSPSGEYDPTETDIGQAIIRGDLDSAVTKLIARDLPGDALLVASYGGADLVARAQNAYLRANADKSPHLRTVWATSTKNFTDLVNNSVLSSWPAVLRATAGNAQEQHLASDKLSHRLIAADKRSDALGAALKGRNASVAAGLWLDELPGIEQQYAGETTAFGVRVKALQQVVEKIAAVCAKIGLPKSSEPGADRLFTALRDYADLAAQQGDLALAEMFLDMLPEEYSADKARVKRATAPVSTPAKPAVVSRPQTAFSGSVPVVPANAAAAHNSRVSPVRATGMRTRVPPLPVQQASPVLTPPVPGSMPAPALASIQKSQQQAQAQAAPVPNVPAPPPAAGASAGASISSGLGSSSTLDAPFKGWNDVPELPIQPKRTRAAPAKVAPPPRQPSFSAPPVNGSPRQSVSQDPPAPPAPTPRAPNPYAPKQTAVRTASGAVNSAYVPSSPPPAQIPRPYSRSSSQRIRAPPAPPKAGAPAAAPAAPSAPPMAGPPKASAPPAASAPPPAASARPAAAPPASSAPPTEPVAAPPAATNAAAVDDSVVKSVFTGELARVRPIIEAQYPKQYKDTERRLQLLYSHISSLDPVVVEELNAVADSVSRQEYEEAITLNKKVQQALGDTKADWFTGVDRLLKMAKAVPS